VAFAYTFRMDRQQREELDILISQNKTQDWWTPELFEERVRPHFPPALTVIAPPPKNENYNCFIYTLGLSENSGVLRDSGGFIYSAFIQKLLNNGLLKRIETPEAGDYVFYQDLPNYPNEITHAGIIQDDGSAISKWTWGPLIKHQIIDVPASYGDTIWHASKIGSEKVEKIYWELKAFNTKP